MFEDDICPGMPRKAVEARYESGNLHIHCDTEAFYPLYKPTWAYIRIRGLPVTPEQAFEMLRRTERTFQGTPDFVYTDGSYQYINTLIDRSPRDSSFVHPDGHIGANDILCGSANEEDALGGLPLLAAFPFLKMVVAFTGDDEMDWCSRDAYDREAGRWVSTLCGHWAWDEDLGRVVVLHGVPEIDHEARFCRAIAFGAWLHDGQVDVVGREQTVALYQEYAAKCGCPPEFFFRKFELAYDLPEEPPLDAGYIARLYEANGLTPPKPPTPSVPGKRSDDFDAPLR